MSAGGNGAVAPRPDHECKRPHDFVLIDKRFEANEESRDKDRACLEQLSDRIGARPDAIAGTHATGLTAMVMGLADAMTAMHNSIENRFNALSLQIIGAAKSPVPSDPPGFGPEDTLSGVVSPDWALKKIRREQRKSTLYGISAIVASLAALAAAVAKLIGR